MKIDRAHAIRQHLFVHGPSSIGALADAVAVSLPTLRRDLSALEKAGVVIREHGGARLAEQVEGEVAFERREAQALSAKRAIGEAAYDLLVPGASVFLDSGTTVLQLARRIRVLPLPLAIFTNCLPAAQMLIDVPGVRVTLLGGSLRKENASVVGPLAETMLERLWFSHLFLGAGAISDDHRMWSADDGEARLNAAMIARSERRTLLVDSSKFGQRLTYAVASVEDLHAVITDAGLEPRTAERMRRAGIDLRLVSPPARAGDGA